MADQKNSILGMTLAFVATAGFSTKAIFIKLAYSAGVDTVTLMFLRAGYTLPMLVVSIWWFSRKSPLWVFTRQDALVTLGLGLLGYYVASLLDLLALQFIPASLERMILYLYPTLVVIFGALFLHQKIQRRESVSLAVSYAGVVLLFAGVLSWEGHLTVGIVMVFGSATAFAVFMLASGHYIGKVGAVRFTNMAMIASTLAVLLQYVFVAPLHQVLYVKWDGHVWAVMLALLATIIPSYCMAAGIAHIGARKAALIGLSGPVITLLLAFALFQERLTWVQWLGIALIMAGIGVLQRHKTAKKTVVSPSATAQVKPSRPPKKSIFQ